VNGKGFAPFTSAEFNVAVKQAYELPDVSLSVARASIEVTVRPTELIAAEQIRAEEKQRLIGFFPNFYTSYVTVQSVLPQSEPGSEPGLHQCRPGPRGKIGYEFNARIPLETLDDERAGRWKRMKPGV
jgi:hypothetical protein